MDAASRFSSNLARTMMMIKETTMWMMNTMMTTMMIKEMTRWMMIMWIMIKGMMTIWMMWCMINLSQSIPGSAGTGTGFGDAGGGAPPRKKSRPSIKRITIV